MEEHWKPIPGYEGFYEASNLGSIQSLDRYSNGRKLKGKVLTKSRTGTYHAVTLYLDGKAKTVRVQYLVTLAFIGPRPKGLHILHGPKGSFDNSLDNLSYGTRSDNMIDRKRDGTDWQVNKTHCPRGHKLESPNLVKCLVKSGKGRGCLACSRGQAHVNLRRRRGLEFSEYQLKLITDDYYRQILMEV